jgi:hypothetical protein
MAKNTTPSDADVANIVDQLNAQEAAAKPAGTVWPSAPGPAAVSPASLSLAADDEAPNPKEGEAEKPSDDDRPIVVNLPMREDPTKLHVAEGIPQVQPVDAQGNLVNDVAAKSATEIVTHKVAENVLGSNPAAHQQVNTVAQIPNSVHATTPIAATPTNTVDSLSEEIRKIIADSGCTAWVVEGEKPYWSVRHGPRQTAVPMTADVERWRGACASISVA